MSFINRAALKIGLTFQIGLESMFQKPDFDVILVPVGGGLLNGIATAAKVINPDVQIIGVQSEASPAQCSFNKHGDSAMI